MQAKRWMLRVTFKSGDDVYLRHGSRIGHGPIVRFNSRRDAEINIELVSPGLDDGTVLVAVPYDSTKE